MMSVVRELIGKLIGKIVGDIGYHLLRHTSACSDILLCANRLVQLNPGSHSKVGRESVGGGALSNSITSSSFFDKPVHDILCHPLFRFSPQSLWLSGLLAYIIVRFNKL